MGIDDRAGDRETEPGTATLARAALVDTVEALEHALEMLGWDSRPVVADGDLHPLVSHLGDNGDAAARLGVRDGIAHEVAQHLGEPVRIGLEHAVDRFDVEVALAEQRQIATHVLEEVLELDLAWLDQVPGLGARQSEHVVDQAIHLVHRHAGASLCSPAVPKNKPLAAQFSEGLLGRGSAPASSGSARAWVSQLAEPNHSGGKLPHLMSSRPSAVALEYSWQATTAPAVPTDRSNACPFYWSVHVPSAPGIMLARMSGGSGLLTAGAWLTSP